MERGQPPPFVEQDEALATYAEKIGPDRPPARSGALGARAGADRARPAPPHRRALGARRRDGARGAPRRRASGRGRQLAGAPGAGGARGRRTGGCCIGTAAGALELLEVQPPGGRRDGRVRLPARHAVCARVVSDDRARAGLRVRGAAAGLRARRVRRRRAARAGARARRARPGAGDAPRLRRGAAARHARLPDRAPGRARAASGWTRRCSRRCGSGCYELLYLAAPPTARSSPTPWSSPRAPAAGTGSSTPCCAAPRARGRRCSRRSTTRRPSSAAIAHSHPLWIARLWWAELGAAQDARALLACDNEPGELALRANTLVSDAAALAAGCRSARRRSRYAGTHDSRGARARGSLRPARLAAVGRGCVHRAVARGDAARAGARPAAGRAGARPVRGARRQEHAPGGADGRTAARWSPSSATAGAPPSCSARRGACARPACASCSPTPRSRCAGEAPFDRVLVDPPCSGLGTLQARADLRWRVTPEQVPELARTQAAILAAGAAAVRPGGVLVYSTCTISPSENERQIFDLPGIQPRLRPR